jgi:MinD-like ATPase involved in chromosome partitioning or flagellar assembly
MAVPVLTAVTGAAWEADLVSELGRADHGVTVVRRCVDLAELLSAAAAGTARAALLSADLRRLDRDAVSRLTAARVAVVGLVDPGDTEAEQRLRQLGVIAVLPADAGATRISMAVVQAVAEIRNAQTRDALGDPRAALPDLETAIPPPAPAAGRGRVVAVWGPTGAPGRSTVALGIADEAARLGVPTLLIDADAYGGVIAQLVGLLDESPGLAAACRAAATGRLDPAALAGLAWAVHPTLRVLTGIVRAERWTELRPSCIEVVLGQARHVSRLTVVDCGFNLERDEEVAFDTMAPRRNGATLATLQAADTVVCVGGADPVALQRLIRAITELQELLAGRPPLVVVNRVRKVVVPGSPRREIAAALARYAGITDLVLLPHDGAAVDAALGCRSWRGGLPACQRRRPQVDGEWELVGRDCGPQTRTRCSPSAPTQSEAAACLHRGAGVVWAGSHGSRTQVSHARGPITACRRVRPGRWGRLS